MKKAYLLLYNAACGLGWGFCTLKAVSAIASGGSAGSLYAEVGPVLVAVQTAMLLEIGHSLLGLVPSPVIVVALQVLSRIFIVWGHLYWVPACQQHWSLFLILVSWGVTETVRYAFYFAALLGGVPYPLFWLRYSLFMVLYPSGITGELLQTLVGMGHWHAAKPVWCRLCALALLAYVPGSPGMIANMVDNRRRSFKKRSADKSDPEGIVWPKDKKGARSSTAVNQAILAAAAKAGPAGAEAAGKILRERNWRFKYNEHMVEHVSQCLESEKLCLDMARSGLAAAHEMFKFTRSEDGQLAELPARAAMDKYSAALFETGELVGEGSPGQPELQISYGGPTAGEPYHKFRSLRKRKISGEALSKQLDAWVEYGTIERDVADALKLVQKNQQEWLDLKGTCFVLLGAGSAMGPLHFLLSLGATVIAVAQGRTLTRILKEARHSPGRVLFPVRRGSGWQKMLEAGDMDALSKVCGCNLLTQAPEIATWVAGVAPGKALTIGNYTYLDGALHVQIAVACDLVMAKVCESRKDTGLAFLGTPTDATVVPDEVAEASQSAYRAAPAWMKLWEALGVLKPNKFVSAGSRRFMDAIVPDQGPNYILAKRLQHWRAMVARADGHVVSSNVAPSAATASVTKNASFAAAFGGMHIFRPMEVFYEELALTAMAALLVYDVRCPASSANPATRLPHPMCLFERTSFHGGLWRCPYGIATIGIPSALTHYASTLMPQIVFGVAAVACMVQYVALGTLPAVAETIVLAGWSVVREPWAQLAHYLALPWP